MGTEEGHSRGLRRRLQRITDKLLTWWTGAVLWLLPVYVGWRTASQWPDAGENYYSAMAQVIATLFLAIAIELVLSRDRLEVWNSRLDRLFFGSFIAASWVGLLACLRALAGDRTAWMAGLAAAGVTCAGMVIAVALFTRLSDSGEEWPGTLAGAFLLSFVFFTLPW